jgi:Ca2+-binding EF-hand superfamily protein
MEAKRNLRWVWSIAFAGMMFFAPVDGYTQGGGPPSDPKAKFIQHFDEDDDGMVSGEEYPGPEEEFASLDADGDGKINADEAPSRGGFLRKHDKNKDGKISKEEFIAGLEERFTRLDKNQDGYLDESELPKGHPGRGRHGTMGMTHLDKDKDGKVSRAEFPGTDERFTKLDKNNDGAIDSSEMPQRPPRGERHGCLEKK